MSAPVRIDLSPFTPEHYRAGQAYAQAANEVHRTDAQDGTITLMERPLDQDGHADVFWPVGEEWGNAKPRPATLAELQQVVPAAITNLEYEITMVNQ